MLRPVGLQGHTESLDFNEEHLSERETASMLLGGLFCVLLHGTGWKMVGSLCNVIVPSVMDWSVNKLQKVFAKYCLSTIH